MYEEDRDDDLRKYLSVTTQLHFAPMPQLIKSLKWHVVYDVQSYRDELESDTDEPEGLCRLRPRGGDPVRPGLRLGDFDLRHGSFHSSGRFTMGTVSFFGCSSNGPLEKKNRVIFRLSVITFIFTGQMLVITTGQKC